jgi:hypothetical protein
MVSRTVFGDRAPADWVTASFLSDARTRSRKVRSGRTRYLEVSDLGSESKRLVRSSCFARFYEGPGASTRIYLTYDPVETKHPQAR